MNQWADVATKETEGIAVAPKAIGFGRTIATQSEGYGPEDFWDESNFALVSPRYEAAFRCCRSFNKAIYVACISGKYVRDTEDAIKAR